MAHMPESFGDVLRHFRIAAGLSQEELAERAALSTHGISDLERGARRSPYPSTIQRLAEGLGLTGAERAILLAARARTSTPLYVSANQPRAGLRASVSSFVGREQELSRIGDELMQHHLITLVGPGGVGKTRLALEVASRLRATTGLPAVLVELSALADSALIAQEVAAALNVREQPGQRMREVVAGALSVQSSLLVLDNCEHLIMACAELAEYLLGSCPELRILATSREPLAITGEVAWRVPVLSLAKHLDANAELLAQSEAAQLFVERGAATGAGFQLTADNAVAVGQSLDVLAKLGGLKIAGLVGLVLGAAQVRIPVVVDGIIATAPRGRAVPGSARLPHRWATSSLRLPSGTDSAAELILVVALPDLILLMIAQRSGATRRLQVGTSATTARGLAFHIAVGLGDLSVAEANDVHAADVPSPPIVAPSNDAVINRHELFFYVEPGARVGFKKLREELAHCIDALETRPVRRWTGVLEYGVLGHLGEHAFDVMALQGRVESLHNSERLIRHRN